VNKALMTRQILHNCQISDARHAGIYSICGLAMRLRDLFKWEHDLPPWIEKDSTQVLTWIGEKEELWESLAGQDYADIRIGGTDYSPFDTLGINKTLNGQNLFYGAGYAHSMKPSFLLAEINGIEKLGQWTVVHLGREHARDLLTLPAFTQDNQVVLRREAARMFLWDQLLYISASARPALNFVLDKEGIRNQRHEALHGHLPRLSRIYEKLLIQHEIGELEESVFPGELWREILAAFPHTAIEYLARTLKDLLADTGPQGLLNQLVSDENEKGLGLYLAFRQSLSKSLFPELQSAFVEFCKDGKWEHIVQAGVRGHETARVYALMVCDLFRKSREKGTPDSAAKAILATMQERNLI
jgi:hypothetical protein